MSEKVNELLQTIVRQPSLLDRYSSADLKRIGKLLVDVIITASNKAATAEDRLKVAEAAHAELLERVHLLDGEVIPPYSYLHKEEVLAICDFTEFHLVEDEQGMTCCACGGTGDGTLHALYEFDWADFGRPHANEHCRQMVTHLRRSFTPRQPKTPTQSEKKDV